MATMKMCKPAQESGHCGGATMAAGQGRPCGPCGAQAPEKKQHFWHRQRGQQQQHGSNPSHGHGHKLTQCFGAPHGSRPLQPRHGGGAYHESEEIEIVRVEKREEHVRFVHHSNNSSGAKKCMEHYKYSDSSDSDSDSEGKGRKKKC